MLKRVFGRQLSWREVSAMAVLVAMVIVLSVLDAREVWKLWQEHQAQQAVQAAAQAQLLQEEVPAEWLEQEPAFTGWLSSDQSDEDNGILNLTEEDSGL